MKVIETKRLLLRTWKNKDEAPYFEISQDPKTIEFLPGPMTIDEVKDFIKNMNQQFLKYRYTFWATEEKATKTLIGFIGLNKPKWHAHFTPCVEIGWQLGTKYWGKGYATEGAKAVLKYGFEKLGLKEIVSFTVPTNLRSIRVMEKIGMKRDLNGDFFHPKLPKDHKFALHVLYRIKNRSKT